MNEIEIPPKIIYEDKKIEISGLNINYWDEGNGSETILLIHGFTGNVEEWYFQFSHFKINFRIIALDLRGHGKSEIKDYDLKISDISNDIKTFLEKKGISKVNLIGHSMGGMIALDFAINYPDKVNKLILISTTPIGTQRAFSESQIAFFKSTPVDQVINMMSKMASIPLEKQKPERRDFYKKLQDWSRKRRGKGITNDTLVAYLTLTSGFDVVKDLKNIKVPTLLLCGDKDKLVRDQNSKILNEKIPNSKLIIFSECGHAPQSEYFIDCNKHLEDFLLSK